MAKLGAEDNRADLAEMVANEARGTRHIAHAKIEFAAHVHLLVEECADVQGILGERHDKNRVGVCRQNQRRDETQDGGHDVRRRGVLDGRTLEWWRKQCLGRSNVRPGKG